MNKIDRYLAERFLCSGVGDTGISSNAMLREALGGERVTPWEFPKDWSDLGRCRRAYRKAPLRLKRRMHPRLVEFRRHVSSKNR